MTEFNMAGERRPQKKMLLPPGWREFEIYECSKEVKSKKGNNQYVMKFRDSETGYTEDVYAVSEPKKRWFLKEIMDACDIKNEEEKYYFNGDLRDNIIGKKVIGLVEHEPNTYIDRNGNEVHSQQHRIVEIKSTKERAWDDEIK